MRQNEPRAPVEIACLDLEGVLVPEVWIAVAKRTGIDDLLVTTREIPDYDELMSRRLEILGQNGVTIGLLNEVVAGLGPLEGAREFLDWLRERMQVIVLSDTFYEFAAPLMRQLGHPTIFCHSFTIGEGGEVEAYNLRMPDQKREAVRRFRELNFRTIAAGDSYNDTTMLGEADRGILFRAPDNVVAEFPQYPVATEYDQLRRLFEDAQRDLRATPA